MEADFIEIDNILINSDILKTNFTCDLNKCKGACCTMESDYGAPLLQEEVNAISSILPIVKEYLPKEHIEEIEVNGFWIKRYDQIMTSSFNKRACVFVTYDGEIAKCGIEKAYNDGKVDFIKPVSCHLFPIRVSYFGGQVLRYEKYSECNCALEKGEKTQIKIIDFCRDALVRQYGKEWFNKTKETIGN